MNQNKCKTIKDSNGDYNYCYMCGEELRDNICVNKSCKMYNINVNKYIKDKNNKLKLKKYVKNKLFRVL